MNKKKVSKNVFFIDFDVGCCIVVGNHVAHATVTSSGGVSATTEIPPFSCMFFFYDVLFKFIFLIPLYCVPNKL